MQNNKKILCLGNNTEDTDKLASKIANEYLIEYHGLLTQITRIIGGCYQTSFYDMSYGDLIELADQFDEIIILDQSKESYLDEHGFYQTISFGKHFIKTKIVIFQNQKFAHTIEDVIKENKSFCILPFIQSVVINNKNYPCCQSTQELSKFDALVPYNQDVGRNQLKEKMIKGNKSIKHCAVCYNLEDSNIISPRISQTIEWTNRLNITALNELDLITAPVSYEVRASNKCNLMCRSCRPHWSNLIDKENKKTKFFISNNYAYTGYEYIDIHSIEKLYVAGGEPTISIDLYEFLKKCISLGKTDFEIQLNTNAANLSTEFKLLIKHFTNLTFEISIDGYGKINQYVRWPTKWDKLINNIDYLYNQKYSISFNSVMSIYTINSCYDLINFLSIRYKNTTHHLTSANFKNDILSPYNHPCQESILTMLVKVKQHELYKNDLTIRSYIDSCYNWYSNNYQIDLEKLEKFFDYNDLLDQTRDVRLIDYIPELEECRKLITKQT